jgi:hypothetical protein
MKDELEKEKDHSEWRKHMEKTKITMQWPINEPEVLQVFQDIERFK